MRKLAAWAHGMSPKQIRHARAHLPGIRVIHYRGTYTSAEPGDVAFVNSGADASAAARIGPRVFQHAILGDERNGKPGDEGPSGTYESPQEYANRISSAIDILETAGIRWSTKGLSQAGGEFDMDYLRQLERLLPAADLRATNGRVYRLEGILGGLRDAERARWSVTLLPLRLNWWPLRFLTLGSWLRELLCWPGYYQALRILHAKPEVETIGIWCLRETMWKGEYQDWHGLIDRNGRLTRPGRITKKMLKEVQEA